MARSEDARLKRSYERNVVYSRFWSGVGTALLIGLLLFVANALWEVGTDPKIWTPLAEIVFAMGILILAQFAAIGFALAWTFRNLYLSDDCALARIEQDNQEAIP